jgi:hypothetical protein
VAEANQSGVCLNQARNAVVHAWGVSHSGSPRRNRAPAIAYWLGSLRYVPSVQEIRDHIGCSRATAYRWRRFALAAARQDPEVTP